MYRAEFHIHTCFSPDSSMSLDAVLGRCKQKNIAYLFVTDHNTTEGAKRLQEQAPFHVIVGEEITTTEGEIIGYFLTQTIPQGLLPEEAMDRIHAQNGLVCIPHPFDRFRQHVLTKRALTRLVEKIDLLEVFNARNIFFSDNVRAKQFAEMNNIQGIAASDAHTVRELGSTYVEIVRFDSPETLLSQLAPARWVTKKSSPMVHAHTWMEKRGLHM